METTPVTDDFIINDFPIVALRRKLLSWFQNESRDLPWRKDSSLYGTWISEIMLQQTTVATVVPYWELFMAKYPNVETLASATEAEVLDLWSGLGYYRRARNIFKASKQIMSDFDGCLPATREDWIKLPGVGDYASGAIASLGLGIAVAAIDVNARRVITRLLVDDLEILPHLKPRMMQSLGTYLVDPGNPGSWNEAVMELGALFCHPQNPKCNSCPVEELCRAHRASLVSKIPTPPQPKTTIKVVMAQWLLVTDSGLLVLEPGSPVLGCEGLCGTVVRDDFSNLNHGLWLLPQTPWFRDSTTLSSEYFLQTCVDAFAGMGLALENPQKIPIYFAGKFTHSITRHRIRVENIMVDMRGIKGNATFKSLKTLPETFWGPGKSPIPFSELKSAFLSEKGNLSHCLPVSKMVSKAHILMKKTI